jgi:mono/diheme cytochrome c family protein
VEVVASTVSVIDLAREEVCKQIPLPNGSTLLRDVRISPDGRYAVVTHTLAHFHLPTTQVDRGWINSNAASLIDVAELRLINTVLLDNIDSGAANPWAATWSLDGKTLCISHAGTHELSVINFPALLAKLARFREVADTNAPNDSLAASRTAADVPNDLSFLVGLRQRIKLSEADRGPRAVALAGTTAYIANYFSDSLSLIDFASPNPSAKSIDLSAVASPVAAGILPASKPRFQPRGTQWAMAKPNSRTKTPLSATGGAITSRTTVIHRGESLFNDATICFQGWQSCASCHSSDARVDGMNWDNLNDGIGNPKNSKSLLHAHRTPPSMWLGVRSNAYVAVRAGIRNSMFTVQPPEVAEAIDEYLRSLQPIASPYLIKGRLSSAAERGRKLFFSEAVGCSDCHKGALYTDQKRHDVGTAGQFDQPTDRFDTPSLIELWRTAPYLHDGSALTIRAVLTTRNPRNRHGYVSDLTPEQLKDLEAYVLSL